MCIAPGTTIAQAGGAAPLDNGRLVLRVIGFDSDAGRAMIALVDRREQFLSREHAPFRSAAVMIREQQVRWVFENVPAGEYAISVFHDENDNGELDSNLLRIPKEAYGFSNDARGTFGPPDYDAAKFRYAGQQRTLTITVR